MQLNDILRGLTQTLGQREVYYVARNLNAKNAPKVINLGPLGELRQTLMTANLDGTYERYPAHPLCRGPEVARFIPHPGIRLPLPPAVPVDQLPRPGLMSLYAFMLPGLGMAIGLAAASANALVFGICVAVTIFIGLMFSSSVDRMTDLYDRATCRAMVSLVNDSWRRPAH